MFSNINSDSLSFAAGVASGTVIGYSLNTTGNLLISAIITTSCGVSRVALKNFVINPLWENVVTKGVKHDADIRLNAEYDEQAALEIRGIWAKRDIAYMFYSANCGFQAGISLGTGVSATSLFSSILSAVLVNSLGVCVELLASKSVILRFDENGNRII